MQCPLLSTMYSHRLFDPALALCQLCMIRDTWWIFSSSPSSCIMGLLPLDLLILSLCFALCFVVSSVVSRSILSDFWTGLLAFRRKGFFSWVWRTSAGIASSTIHICIATRRLLDARPSQLLNFAAYCTKTSHITKLISQGCWGKIYNELHHYVPCVIQALHAFAKLLSNKGCGFESSSWQMSTFSRKLLSVQNSNSSEAWKPYCGHICTQQRQ